MAMRETVGSMQAYFTLTGILGAFSYGVQLASSRDPITAVFSLVGLGLALSYLYLGVRFRKLIISAPSQILTLLKLGGAYLVLVFLLLLASRVGIAGSPGVGAGLLITWYLYANARRLARQAAAAEVAQAPRAESA